MALPIRRGRGGRAASVRAVEVADFSGGLNLDAGQFNLAPNELPELLDMDVVGRGGVRRRRAVRYLPNGGGSTFDQCPRSVWSFETASGDKYLYLIAPKVVSGNNRLLWYSLNGGDFTAFTGDPSVFGLGSNSALAALTANARTAVAGDAVWGVWDYSGGLGTRPKPFKISGSNVLSLPNEAGCLGANNSGWTDQIGAFEAGSVAGLANGRCIAAHYGYLWVANTVENTAQNNASSVQRFTSRVRWSHPGVYDRWREDDYIDVEVGKNGDEITALVPFRDHLLVFKNRSVHAIYGDNPDNFAVVNLSNEFGAVSQEAVAVSPFGVFFFDRAGGLWAWDGSTFRWPFTPMASLLRDGVIPPDRRNEVAVGWVENRVWVGVPWRGVSTQRGRTLVYDPAVGRQGAWTMYSLGFGPFASLRRTDSALLFVAGCSGSKMLQALEGPGDVDEMTVDGNGDPVATPIRGSFRTPWVEAGVGADKQWKRPDVVVTADGDVNLVVDGFFDYVAVNDAPRKTFYVRRTVGSTDLFWAESPVDDPLTASEWNGASWAGDDPSTMVARGSNIGKSRALSLRFTTPAGAVLPRWSVDGIVVKFRQKRVRG
jgi:hypothetical protein